MRKLRFDHLLAGTMLALVAGTPGAAVAAPQAEAIAPVPPTINGRAIMHRDVAPAPAPAQAAVPTEPTEPKTDAGFVRSTLDKIFAANDAQISEKLRGVANSRQLERRFERPAERKAVESFYASRNYAPLWIVDGALSARAKATIARLKNAGADGLDANDYPVPDFASLSGPEQLAEADVALTSSAMTFARHLQSGRIAPARVFVQVDYGEHAPDPADVLRKLTGGSDINATFDGFNPPHQGFKDLKAQLAALHSNASTSQTDNRIAEGAPIKPGTRDSRVPALRGKLGIGGKPDDILYDKRLFDAVRRVQQKNDIKPTGVVDNKTISILNGPKRTDLVDHVVANMERWRWLPRDFGKTYVMVNIPDYTLKVVNDHSLVWHTKIVAGKPQTPTPLLAASMDNVLVNPSWYVPQSIIQNELLPLYARDPQIFDRMGLEVKRGPDGHINVVQPPGAANALGRIKFNFPNKFQVYLHDTPEKKLFAYDKRAFSHGCMRVEDPTMFGEIMLRLAQHGPTPNSRQIYAMFGKDEHTFKLQEHPTVLLTYQTAFVDDAGKLQFRDDIYGFDQRITSILHSDERRVADVAPPPDPKRDAATDKANQEILMRVERREAQNPFQFFDNLFR
jgi:murein L,D-transpeptidase YcbB/YkuD